MSASEVPSGVSSNLFPNVSVSERAAGVVKYRKLFFKNANADNIPLLNARVWQDSNTPGQDRVAFCPVSQRLTQSGLTGGEAYYGMGLLFAGVLAGAASLQVEVEDGTVTLFRNGDLVRVSNRVDPFSVGDEHWARIDQAPSVSGNVVTIHLDVPVPVAFLSGAKVSSAYEAGEVKPTLSGASVTSGSGVFTSSLITLSNIGTVEQSWTLTFTSASAFDIAGDTLGAVGSGNTSSGAAITNPQLGQPYFTLPAAALTGAFQAGDTVTFSTHPSAVPLFLKRDVPAGTAAAPNNSMSIFMDGESA